MKVNVRLLWMKWHAYLSCFFVPITLLYIITGVLYLFDITGGIRESFEYSIELPLAWPEERQAAEDLILEILKTQDHPTLPEDHYPEEGVHDWYGYKQEVILMPTDDPSLAKLIVKEHDLLHQLLIIHKGLAGKFFWLFGILLGVNMLFSVVSGLILALQLPRIKLNSLFALLGGSVLLVLVFVEGG